MVFCGGSKAVEGNDEDDFVGRRILIGEEGGGAAPKGFGRDANRRFWKRLAEQLIGLDCGGTNGLEGRDTGAFAVAGVFHDVNGIVRRKARQRVGAIRGLTAVAVEHEPDVFRR